MASRISQMRNAAPAFPQQPMSQQQLNESIERTRALMSQMQNIPNKETVIMNLLQQNPQLGMLSNLLRNGNNLEGIATNMAQVYGLDINQLIQKLIGGM